MKSLEAFSDVSADSMQGKLDTNGIMASWRCISLGIMAYRQGYAPTAKTWCQKCLSFSGNNPPRSPPPTSFKRWPAINWVKRSWRFQNWRRAGARWRRSFQKIWTRVGLHKGFWYDWLFARILLREAEELIQTPATAPKWRQSCRMYWTMNFFKNSWRKFPTGKRMCK